MRVRSETTILLSIAVSLGDGWQSSLYETEGFGINQAGWLYYSVGTANLPVGMLYLPAFRFEDNDLRLPSPPVDILRFCTGITDSVDDRRELESVFAINPSLLVWALQHVAANSEQPVRSPCELISGLTQGCLDTDIESLAFEPAPALTPRQWRSLSKWLTRPTIKRLCKFLKVVLGLDAAVADRLATQIVADNYLISRSDNCSWNPSVSMRTIAERWSNLNSDDLPVRRTWLTVAKLYRLESEFDCELHRQKLQAMKQLAYGASHEINNPLANIATRAQSLMSDESDPSRRQRLSVIYAQAMRAHEMISDMMLFAHPPELNPEMVEPRQLIQMVVEELRSELVVADIKIQIRQYPHVPAIELDVTQFAVAIKSLLQNAMHAIHRGGEIRIQIWRRRDHTIGIAVADTGSGVDPAIANQIFDPFFSGREAGRGLGFGLSKAWRIAQLHGGQICLDLNHAPGARFVISLPLIQDNLSKRLGNRIDIVCAA